MPVIVFFKTRESGCILIIETGMCSGITITFKHRGMNIKFGGLWFYLRYSCLLPVLETVYSYLLLTPSCCWCLPAEFSAASSFICVPVLYWTHPVLLFGGSFQRHLPCLPVTAGASWGQRPWNQLCSWAPGISTCLLIWDRITELKQNCLGNGRTSFFPSGKCCEITEEDN